LAGGGVKLKIKNAKLKMRNGEQRASWIFDRGSGILDTIGRMGSAIGHMNQAFPSCDRRPVKPSPTKSNPNVAVPADRRDCAGEWRNEYDNAGWF
jgi:hypothetical protein